MSATTALIADDLKVFLVIAKSFLVRRGFDVLTAENGTKALELARARHPRLILLDLIMPGMDGAEACAAMRRDPTLAFTPILIMSATGNEEIRDRCHKAGCTNFLVKPPNPTELLTIIAHILSVRERKPAHMTVTFNEAARAEGRQSIGKAGNISGTGMLLLAGKPIHVGLLLQLEFVVPTTNRTIKVQGKVLRLDKSPDGTYGAGIHFVNLSPDDQQEILTYVSA